MAPRPPTPASFVPKFCPKIVQNSIMQHVVTVYQPQGKEGAGRFHFLHPALDSLKVMKNHLVVVVP